jgi:hypothetical protein
MSARRGTIVHHLTAAVILRWVAFYTRDLTASVAEARRDEIASDIYEQSANIQPDVAARRRLAASLAFRAARGIAADLAWRSAQTRLARHEGDTMSINPHRPGQLLDALVTAVAVLLVLSGALAAVRDLSNPLNQTPGTLPVLLTSVTTATAAGLALSRRPSTKLAGLIVMALASLPLMWGVGLSLWSISATAGETIMNGLVLVNRASAQNAVYVVSAPGIIAAALFGIAAIVVHRRPSPGIQAAGEKLP